MVAKPSKTVATASESSRNVYSCGLYKKSVFVVQLPLSTGLLCSVAADRNWFRPNDWFHCTMSMRKERPASRTVLVPLLSLGLECSLKVLRRASLLPFPTRVRSSPSFHHLVNPSHAHLDSPTPTDLFTRERTLYWTTTTPQLARPRDALNVFSA